MIYIKCQAIFSLKTIEKYFKMLTGALKVEISFFFSFFGFKFRIFYSYRLGHFDRPFAL